MVNFYTYLFHTVKKMYFNSNYSRGLVIFYTLLFSLSNTCGPTPNTCGQLPNTCGPLANTCGPLANPIGPN